MQIKEQFVQSGGLEQVLQMFMQQMQQQQMMQQGGMNEQGQPGMAEQNVGTPQEPYMEGAGGALPEGNPQVTPQM